MTKNKINIVTEGKSYYKASDEVESIAQALAYALKRSASFTAGDQEKPCAILWTDPEALWEKVIPELKSVLPQIYILGQYNPSVGSGPAIWLRCIESGAIELNIVQGDIPVFYLPGASRQQLRDVEDCPSELQPLVELQFRGTVWAHPNGKDWTPYAFLSSEHEGLGLEVAKDSATAEALLRALPQVLKEKLADLRHKKLDSDYFNGLLMPDLPASILNWMSNPNQFKSVHTTNTWKAFCQQCMAEYKIHPEKDGELRAAELLGHRRGGWKRIWDRFIESPKRYSGVVNLLESITAPGDVPLLDQDSWPLLNSQREAELAQALIQLKDKRADEVRPIIFNLEQNHGIRRDWVWAEVGRSQFALALEELNHLAKLTEKPLAASSIEELGELYANTGWETDATALASMLCCNRLEHEEPICATVRSLYSQWLDDSARNLQTLLKSKPNSLRPRLGPIEAVNGRVIIFTDGLRFDLVRMVSERLYANNLIVELDWDWAPFPGVTFTAKPYVSPVAQLFKGGEAGDEFNVTITKLGQRLNNERLHKILCENGIQVLKEMVLGDINGKAWTEIGGIDEHGHNEGWKLAKYIMPDLQDITDRILQLLSSGWKEVIVVTDHGWLLLPGGLPKIELPKFLTEYRWGRCAAMKDMAATDLPTLPWYWNPAVQIASPPGVGCFKAGKEYDHGGISLQELVVPRMVIKASGSSANQSKLANIKWIGLRCRVTVNEPVSGLKVDLRTRQADATSSKVEGGKSRELGIDGTVSLPVGDDRDEGIEVDVVLINLEGRIVHTVRTVIGGK